MMHENGTNKTEPVENGMTSPWYIPNQNTAVWMPGGFICGVFLTCIIFKCHIRKRQKLSPNTTVREDSYYQENAVYWGQGSELVEFRERRRTEVAIFDQANIRNAQTQTEIESNLTDFFESGYTHPFTDYELDNMSIAPPPPPPLDLSPPTSPEKPPRRRSKDDCIRTMPSYRKSNIPSRLQNTWLYRSEDKLSSSNHFAEFLDEAFKDQNSPLHQGQDHYMSVRSVVLIPNCEDAPPSCHEILRHSYINLKGLAKNMSDRCGLDKSQQIAAEYENTQVWVKSKESDLSDEETHVDCRDKGFQECVRDTLRRKETQSRAETDDQYSAFASLSAKPERPRTGYVVMELTDEVMSFLKVREKKLDQFKTSSGDISSSDIYYDDRLKNGYLSMHDHKH